MPFSEGRIPSLTARRALDRPTGLNRELSVAEGVRTGLGPPVGGAWVVCRFGLFLIDKSAFPPYLYNDRFGTEAGFLCRVRVQCEETLKHNSSQRTYVFVGFAPWCR